MSTINVQFSLQTELEGEEDCRYYTSRRDETLSFIPYPGMNFRFPGKSELEYIVIEDSVKWRSVRNPAGKNIEVIYCELEILKGEHIFWDLEIKDHQFMVQRLQAHGWTYIGQDFGENEDEDKGDMLNG